MGQGTGGSGVRRPPSSTQLVTRVREGQAGEPARSGAGTSIRPSYNSPGTVLSSKVCQTLRKSGCCGGSDAEDERRRAGTPCGDGQPHYYP